MILDTRELSVLRAVIERGSVTLAASALNVSQPAVSRTLAQIEHRLGISLFRRERQRLHLTPEAEMLYGDIVQAVCAIEAVERRARDLKDGRSGALRIASIAAFANSILPRTVARLRQRKPGIEYVIDIFTAREVAQRVATFRAEVGLLIDTATIPGIDIEELITFPFGCLMPADHPLASRSSLRVTEIAAEPLICLNRALPLGGLAQRLFEQQDLALRPVAEVSQSSVASALVAAAAGIALLDQSSTLALSMAGFAFVPITPAERIVGRIVLPGWGGRTAASLEFCAELRALVQEIVAAPPCPPVPDRTL